MRRENVLHFTTRVKTLVHRFKRGGFFIDRSAFLSFLLNFLVKRSEFCFMINSSSFLGTFLITEVLPKEIMKCQR